MFLAFDFGVEEREVLLRELELELDLELLDEDEDFLLSLELDFVLDDEFDGLTSGRI